MFENMRRASNHKYCETSHIC